MNTKGDVLTEVEASLLVPDILDNIGWQEGRLRAALCTLYGKDLPPAWADGLVMLRQARRWLLQALAEDGSDGHTATD